MYSADCRTKFSIPFFERALQIARETDPKAEAYLLFETAKEYQSKSDKVRSLQLFKECTVACGRIRDRELMMKVKEAVVPMKRANWKKLQHALRFGSVRKFKGIAATSSSPLVAPSKFSQNSPSALFEPLERVQTVPNSSGNPTDKPNFKNIKN